MFIFRLLLLYVDTIIYNGISELNKTCTQVEKITCFNKPMSNIKILKWQKRSIFMLFFLTFCTNQWFKKLQIFSFKTFLQQQQNILIVVDFIESP